jgi:hypothetical protein
MARFKRCGELHFPRRGRTFTVRIHCRRALPLDAFRVDPRKPDGCDLICRDCAAAESRARYWRNPDKARAQSRESHHRHRDEIAERKNARRAADGGEKAREQHRRYRERHGDAIRERARKRAAETRNAINARQRERRQADLEAARAASRASYARHAEKRREDARRRRAEKRGEAEAA